MARAADEMDADESNWRTKVLVAEMCYFMVNLWRIRFDELSLMVFFFDTHYHELIR